MIWKGRGNDHMEGDHVTTHGRGGIVIWKVIVEVVSIQEV